MKRRLLAGALALALLTGGILAVCSASQSETLVSRGYLTGAFWSDLQATVKQEADRDTAALFQRVAAQAGQGGSSSGFAARTGVNGDILAGSTGSGLIWTAGSAILRGGALVDATVGSETAPGGTLTAGHRYLAGADVTLAVSSDTAQWMEEGSWTVTPGDPVTPEPPFTDVAQDAWYHDDVAYVYQSGLFNGVSPTSFGPEGKMRRCMMTTVLYRLAGEPPVSYSGLFQDVPEGQWYTEGTVWAGLQGVVSGVEPGRFAPFSNVTRQEIAVILYRYAGKMGYDVSVSAGLSEFQDAGAVASWGSEAISWAVGVGILNGSDGKLLPNGDATRAQVAAMLHRFADWSATQ